VHRPCDWTILIALTAMKRTAEWWKIDFFAPRMASFAALAARNLTIVLAGILIFCCLL